MDLLRHPLHLRLVILALQVPMTQSLVQFLRCDGQGFVLGSAGSQHPISCLSTLPLTLGISGLLIALALNFWLFVAALLYVLSPDLKCVLELLLLA